MSDTDSFIKEVTEEVRQDRMFRLWKRYAPYVLGVIVAVVGAAAVWNWMEHRAVLAARETGGAFLATDLSSVEAQETLLDAVDGEAEALAQLRLAAALLASEERERAAEVLRAIAARDDVEPVYRDLALLNALKLEAAAGEPSAVIEELAPLTEDNAPYRPMALELRGALQLNAGNLDAAREDLEAAVAAPSATGETRRRVSELLAALGPRADRE